MMTNADTVAALVRLSALGRDDWQEALHEILCISAAVLTVDRVSFWTLTDHPSELVCELGYVAGPNVFERGAVLEEARAPHYIAELRKAVVIVAADAARDPRTAELVGYLEGRSVASLLDVPVWANGRLFGVLCHETVQQREFGAAEQSFAMAVAQAVAMTVERQERAVLAADRHRSRFLSEASSSFGQSLRSEHVTGEAVRLAVPELGEWCILRGLEDRGAPHLAFAHADGRQRSLLQQLAEASFADPALQSRESLLVPSLTPQQLAAYGDPQVVRTLGELGVRSLMFVPFGARGLTGGLIFGTGRRTYDIGDLRFTESYVERVSQALENAVLYERSLEAIKLREAFLSIASHELFTPLTSLQLSAELLQRRVAGAGEAAQRSADIVVRQARRLRSLASRILDASALGSAWTTLQRRRVDLVEVAHGIVDELCEQLTASGSPLEFHTNGPVIGNWDPVRISQVLVNLLDNALKFGRGKPITMTIRADGTHAIITVADHGVGIDPEVQARIFERFSRSNSTRNFPGLGLGLYIVRGIVEAHGGSVHVDAHPGEGARFTVELPGVESVG
jgi:signal transduction histidine kinase